MPARSNIELGLFLRNARLRLVPKVTQASAARLAGIDTSRISRFERGVRCPSPDQLLRLADVYAIDPMFALGKAGFLQLPGFADQPDLDRWSNTDGPRETLRKLVDGASDDEAKHLIAQLVGLRMTRRFLGTSRTS